MEFDYLSKILKKWQVYELSKLKKYFQKHVDFELRVKIHGANYVSSIDDPENGYNALKPPEDESQCFKSQIPIDIWMLNLTVKVGNDKIPVVFPDWGYDQ
jgi:hypothetical protein